MADSRRAALTVAPHGELPHRIVVDNGRRGWNGHTHPITAAVQLMPPAEYVDARTYGYESWQEEAWSFYESLGEFNYGVEWFGEALSRCRLNVAELTPGGDEPEVLTSGAATDIIEQLAGGTDGQSALLKSFATQLTVPGEGYLVGHRVRDLEYEPYVGVLLDAEPDESGHVWTVQPVNTLRRSQRTLRTVLGRARRPWELQVDDARWVNLPPESLVARIWDRNEHHPWRAFSPARAALPVMREIDMYNRYIMATLVSRVALNGVWLIPDEVTLPVNPAYEDATDPFFTELLDVMRSVIKNPGSPASAAPLPLRVPADMIDKFKHLTFATPLDNQIFEARRGAIVRLAASLNLPQEVLTGMGATNQWTSWQLEESAIKIHISPKMELITRGLTVGYLYPMLRAIGEPITTSRGGRITVWYDTSQLTQRPDRSDLAVKLNGMIVISDAATRRETGFTEADAPSDDERDAMLQRALVLQGGQLAGSAYEELTGEPLGPPVQQAPVAGAPPPNSGPGGGGSAASEESAPEAPVTGPPATRNENAEPGDTPPPREPPSRR